MNIVLSLEIRLLIRLFRIGAKNRFGDEFPAEAMLAKKMLSISACFARYNILPTFDAHFVGLCTIFQLYTIAYHRLTLYPNIVQKCGLQELTKWSVNQPWMRIKQDMSLF